MLTLIAFCQGNSSSPNFKDIPLKNMSLLSLGNLIFCSALRGKLLYSFRAEEKHKEKSEN